MCTLKQSRIIIKQYIGYLPFDLAAGLPFWFLERNKTNNIQLFYGVRDLSKYNFDINFNSMER